MEQASGEQLISTAAAISFALAKCLDNKELGELCELLGLVKHNLEIIKYRRIINEKNH